MAIPFLWWLQKFLGDHWLIFIVNQRTDTWIYNSCDETTSESGLRIHSAISSWIHSYFDNVMTKFMINDRIGAWKTDVNLLNRAMKGEFRQWTSSSLKLMELCPQLLTWVLKDLYHKFGHLEKFSLNFSSSWFVIRVNLLHPYPFLFLYGLLLFLWCFSIFVN